LGGILAKREAAQTLRDETRTLAVEINTELSFGRAESPSSQGSNG